MNKIYKIREMARSSRYRYCYLFIGLTVCITVSMYFQYPNLVSTNNYETGHYDCANQREEEDIKCKVLKALRQSYDAEDLKSSISRTIEAINVIEKELKELKAENKKTSAEISSENAIPTQTPRRADKNISTEDIETDARHVKRKVVILLTQMRSGSSVIGELFNQKRGVPYFYEPVFPFGEAPCTSQWQNRTQVIENIAHCRFDKLKSQYASGFKRSQRPDHFAR